MKWERMPLGPLEANAYILSNEDKNCLIFDPGGEGNKINQYIKDQDLKPQAILLTHAHFDHIGAVDEVRSKWNIPVYVHPKEQDWLTNPKLNRSALPGRIKITSKPADYLVEKEGELHICSFTLQILFTPGHSPGSISYYVNEEGIVISGDVLFKGGIGRTDITGGDQKTLIETIREKLLTLPEKTLVLSGHGAVTDIQTEQEQNPFLKGFIL
ncbi:MBL fold metallo-hydrolase [Peribacillus simplex]|uniref:MBL fold metallo-hydrolase n=1 Tax=Peribacillus simplex TaxID=1478 RepID=UPI003CE6E278